MSPMKRGTLLTAREVADLLRVTPNTVGQWARRGLLRTIRVGPKVRRFEYDDVLKLLESRHEAAPRFAR